MASGCRGRPLAKLLGDMADAESKLTKAAKVIGKVAGKVAAVAGAGEAETKPVKENLFQAKYIGSGTFLITKPKRGKNKLHQQRARSRKPGMRK